ncbi:MAG TPA: GNAT family N-acetyltransferase [Planctomycetes bacterium]|nr:GNAT family N-acetyltransferase [Planctomycetota bacterium]
MSLGGKTGNSYAKGADMPDITYRQAQNRDMAFVIELWEAMNKELAAIQQRYAVSKGGELVWGQWAGKVVDRKEGQIFIAETNNEVVGCIMAWLPKDNPIYAARPRGRISDIYVKPEHRGKGVATEMVKLALGFLEKKGAVAVEVNAPKGIDALARLWEKAGLEPFAVRYWKKLKK